MLNQSEGINKKWTYPTISSFQASKYLSTSRIPPSPSPIGSAPRDLSTYDGQTTRPEGHVLMRGVAWNLGTGKNPKCESRITGSSWWLFPTHLKNMLVKLDHLPKGWTSKCLKPPPRGSLYSQPIFIHYSQCRFLKILLRGVPFLVNLY